jgi:DNA (cytosine-5)-methyltransferase 1
MTFGSLFAGIGGLDLGFERAGLRCRWQVEIDHYATKILAKHWPHVHRWDDIRTFPPSSRNWHVDVVAGGFPCQDISQAGRKAGIEGEQSGLWSEMARVIRELEPRWVLVENVSAITIRGLDCVLRDLAGMEYDAEWARLPAARFGAPHLRRRIFVVAHSHGQRFMSDPRQPQCFGQSLPAQEEVEASWVKHPRGDAGGRLWPFPPPGVCGMDDGVPTRLDEARLRCLGNAVVPAIAEWIGRCLMAAESGARTKTPAG